MANARYCKMRPLVAMLKALPELEAMHLKLHDQTHVRPAALPITQPKLRYFYWEGGGEYLRSAGGEYLQSAGAGSSELFRCNPHIDTLHISCTSRSLFKIEDNSPDVLNAIPHDHSLTALTLYDPDGDALTTSDLEDLPPISPALKYLGWETNEGRVLYALEKQGDKTVAKEIPYSRKQSWVWTQNSILDHSEGELWTDPFDGEVIPGLSQL
ncbi:hypothetical protein EIP86_009053 [Pleurotus ostreatoroseus]|nr:hypothetical protein EIP86_009053 [Pleurotus ostreatoroseus]